MITKTAYKSGFCDVTTNQFEVQLFFTTFFIDINIAKIRVYIRFYVKIYLNVAGINGLHQPRF